MEIDLSSSQQKIITKLLQTYLPHTEVWAYGSRVQGKARPSSDLDLVAFASSHQKENIFELRDAFEESDLPFRVDLFIWDEIPKRFHPNIKQVHIIIQKPILKPTFRTLKV